jgi:HEAT repeat protein
MDAGAEIPTSTEEKIDAEGLFKAFTDPEVDAKLNAVTNKHLQTPATVQHLYQMINDYDHQVIDEAVQLRRFITNKLIEDTGHTDARHRLRALELLGKISDVGLFSEKTEISVKHSSTEDLESQIKAKIYKLLGENKTIDTSFERIDEEVGSADDEVN